MRMTGPATRGYRELGDLPGTSADFLPDNTLPVNALVSRYICSRRRNATNSGETGLSTRRTDAQR